MAVHGENARRQGVASLPQHCGFGNGQNISKKPKNFKGSEVQRPQTSIQSLGDLSVAPNCKEQRQQTTVFFYFLLRKRAVVTADEFQGILSCQWGGVNYVGTCDNS